MQTLIDAIAGVLIIPGNLLREMIVAIPLWAAKGIFILYPVLLLVLVFTRDPESMKGKLHLLGDRIDIRPIAAAALVMQILIYAYF